MLSTLDLSNSSCQYLNMVLSGDRAELGVWVGVVGAEAHPCLGWFQIDAPWRKAKRET